MKKKILPVFIILFAGLVLAGCDLIFKDKNTKEAEVKNFIASVNKQESLSEQEYGDLLRSLFRSGRAGSEKSDQFWQTTFPDVPYTFTTTSSDSLKVTGTLTGNSDGSTREITFEFMVLMNWYYLTGISGDITI